MDSNRREDAAATSGTAPDGSWARQTAPPEDYPDPAYASTAYEYPPVSAASNYAPYTTSVLSQQYGSYGTPPSGPEPPRRSNTFWLWVIGGGALVVIIALVAALVILINREDEHASEVAIPPTHTSTVTQTPAMPIFPALPTITLPQLPTGQARTPGEAATESVVYEITGTGFVLNVTYSDGTGGLQTEFNVKLPWRKEVKMSADQLSGAMVVGADFSHDVTCTLTVNGAQQSQVTAKLATCSRTG